MNKNIVDKVQKELDRIAFIAKRKYDRMNSEEQNQVIENIKNIFDYKG